MRVTEDTKDVDRRKNRVLLWVTSTIAALAVGAACAWAAMTILRPAEDPLEATEYTYVAVTRGEVGDSMKLNTVAAWKQAPIAANRAAGVVTGVGIEAGAQVTQGTPLYSVDLRPVVAAAGSVPMFRPIGEGAEGPDVAQAQRMLGELGHYGGTADGVAGNGTVAAIKRWQESLDLEATGVIGEGDLIFVPDLPARVALDTKIVRTGASLSGGEEVLQGLPTTPEFSIPVTDTQANMIPTGTRVEVTAPDGTVWVGTATEQVRDADSGDVSVALTGEKGTAVCADSCGQVPVEGPSSLVSRIVTVETATGLVVPSAALTTTADGATVVVDRKGRRHAVTIGASAKGMSVISGVSEGTEVRVPAKGNADGR